MNRGYCVIGMGLLVLASCRQILGIEEATLICPPDLPGCKLCSVPQDCGPSDECHAWTCEDNACVPVNMPARTKCATGVCSDDPVSVCVGCLEYEDCPGGQCRDRTCSRCDDGIQNGWETGIDCGGGGACKDCLGTACQVAGDCKSGFCEDGTCCVATCDDVCAYCKTLEGDCRPLPKYVQDFNPVCAGENVCDGSGGCRLRSGEVCINPVDCASFRCVMNRCRNEAGEPCSFPQQCVEELCVDGVCQK